MTLAAVERMSLSADWAERVQAARLAARLDAGASEPVVLRLLGDSECRAVADAMLKALLHERGVAAIPPILRSLGSDGTAAEHFCEALLESELDGIDVRGGIIAVLLAPTAPEQVTGALEAISWLAPSGGFPAPPSAVFLVVALADTAEEPTASLARSALVALTLP